MSIAILHAGATSTSAALAIGAVFRRACLPLNPYFDGIDSGTTVEILFPIGGDIHLIAHIGFMKRLVRELPVLLAISDVETIDLPKRQHDEDNGRTRDFT